MKFISDKTKQFLVLIIKIIIVASAFYFIYNQLSNNKSLDIDILTDIVKKPQNIFWVILLLFLTFLNRFVEILKWQNLASLVRKISISEAAKQVLSALTLGIFTPNGIGEYAGKALYFDKKDINRIIFLNMICNGVQVIYAVLFGLLGLFILNQYFEIILNRLFIYVLLVLLTLSSVIFFMRNMTIKGYSIQWIGEHIRRIPKEKHRKNFILALLRYLALLHQYIILYRLFDVELPYGILMCAISSIYLLASCVPNFQFLDFAVKGSIAIYIFSILGVNEWIVVLVATLIWILNIVLPVSIGSIFVFRFKLKN